MIKMKKDLDITSCVNTDKEIWRAIPDDFYSPSIHVTKTGNIGINVGGYVFVLPIREWHNMAKEKYGWKRTNYIS